MALTGTLLFAALPPVAFPGSALAESVFASTGLGRWHSAVDARAGGMGDVTIVAPSRWSFSPTNPSLLARLPGAGVHLTAGTDFTRVDAGLGTETRTDGRIVTLHAATPLPMGLVGAASLAEMSDGRYDIAHEIESTTTYTLRARGTGGWTQGGLALARRYRGLSLGAGVMFPFGSLHEEFTREFDDDEYEDRQEELDTTLEGATFLTFAGHFEYEPIVLAGFVQLPTEGELETERTWEGGKSASSRSFDIPGAFGAGTRVSVSPRLTVVGDIRRQSWSSAELEDSGEGGDGAARPFFNTTEFGAGLQWTQAGERTESSFSRMQLRAGYRYIPWNMAGPALGHRVTDRVLTAGVGIPFRDESGMIDIALRYTSRREADSDLKEDIISVLFGLSFSKQERPY